MISKPKITIGRVDKADLPGLHLKAIDLKVDTGAFTSSIHCTDITIRMRDGEDVLRYRLLDPQHPKYNHKLFATRNFTVRSIRNSFGKSERRYIVLSSIVLFGKKYPIELSLANRGDMKFPILLGRKFLQGKFVVDVSKYNLSYKSKSTLKNKNKKRNQ